MDALDELRELMQTGIKPTAFELLPQHQELVERLIAEYRTLGVARTAAGHRRSWRPPVTRKLVRDQLRKLAERDVRLTPKRLRQLGEEQLLRDCYFAFDSFDEARTAAGLSKPEPAARKPVPPKAVPPRAAILRAIRAAATEIGVAIGDLDSAIVRGAIRHFGSVQEAILAARVHHRKNYEVWSEERVLRELDTWTRAGGRLSLNALRAGGKSALAAVVQRRMGMKTAIKKLERYRGRSSR